MHLNTDTEDLEQIMEVSNRDLNIYIRYRIRKFDPELSQSITKKLLSEAAIYLKGYSNALREHVTLPVNQREIKEFLLERTFEFIKQRLQQSK